MNFFSQIFSNKVLGISMFACFLAQFIKIFTGKEKFIQFSRLFTSGGMPSSHSSFVTSLATLVGIERGFNSTDFAIVTVFALIIMYDASGVRRAVGKQATILNKILDDLPYVSGDRVAVLVNGLGATPLDEQYIVTRKIDQLLMDKGISVHRYYVGEYATSLEMAGLSISLLKLDEELTKLLDYPANTPFFKQL